MSKHAFLSASGAPGWSRCEVKPWREKDLPEETSVFAEEGTKAHELLEAVLQGAISIENADYPSEMNGYVKKTLDYIHNQHFTQLYSEQRLDISWITGEEGALGTADVVGIRGQMLSVIDLKYGRGVEVNAKDNEQLLIYGAAALKEFDVVGDINVIKLVISQPRLGSTSEWLLTIDQLKTKIDILTTKAKRILTGTGGDNYLQAVPGDTQCRFCRVRDRCPERNGFALTTVVNDFVDLDKEEEFLNKVSNAVAAISTQDDKHLATCMDAVDLIESWCAGVRREVEQRLKQDNFSDHRWKLVQGRVGHRKITNPDDIVLMAREHGIEEDSLYEREMMSPAKLEKIFKKEHPVFWAKVTPLLGRAEGKPIVVPADDKRPALNLELDFSPIEDDYIEAALGLTIESKK
jgi:hypothetical protein